VVEVVAGDGEDTLPEQPLHCGVLVVGGGGVGEPVFEVEDHRDAGFLRRADHRRPGKDVGADDDVDIVIADDPADDPVVAGGV
jgi:hypothetical protein